MEKENIIDNIKKIVDKYGIQDFDRLKPQTQQQLISIEEYLQNCHLTYNNCINTINSINVSIRGICNGAKVSKSTIYNNPDVLKKYVDNRLADMNIINVANLEDKQRIKKLEDDLQEINEVLGNNIANFVKNSINERVIKDYEKEIERKQAIIDTHIAERAMQTKKIKLLEERLKSYESNENKVISINKT